MNYYQARQRSSDGKWCWTRMMGTNGPIMAAGACAEHESEGHSTKEDAERCFYNYEIANLRESDSGDEHRPCKKCRAITNKMLTPQDGMGGCHLCDDHRTKEVYEELFPFATGRFITSSY